MKNGASQTKNYSLQSQKNGGIVVQICFDTSSTRVSYGKPLHCINPLTVIEEKWVSELCIGQFM
jgi:hypothetical protein